LERQGIGASVLHVPTIKPFDVEAVCELAASVPFLVTAENHVACGGLGSLVVETLHSRQMVKPVVKIGLPDQFIECGSTSFLQEKYGLLSEHILAAVQAMRKVEPITACS